MAINRDLSDLARPPDGDGLTPDHEPRFIGVLADAWQAANDERSAAHVSSGRAFRHSDAGKCARALSYKAAGIEQSDPMDLTGVWNVTLGQQLHDAWQEQLLARFPDAEIEVECATEGVDSIGFIDAVVHTEVEEDSDVGVIPVEYIIAYELKSIGGFGYKAAVGKARRGSPAEGPKSDHLLQGAINALAIDADELVIGYLSKECISANVGKGMDDLARFCCEWTFTREQFEPLAKLEIQRVQRVLELVDEGRLAPRKLVEMPPGSEVTDPMTGAWQQRIRDEETREMVTVDVGSVWNCNYCSWQSLCATTEPGKIPIDSVKRKGKAA